MIANLLVAGATLLGYALTVMVLVPMGASRRRWTSRNPRTAIAVWIWSLGSGGLALAAGLASVVVAAMRMPQEPMTGLTVGQVLAGVALTLAGYAATAVGGGITSVVVYRAIKNSRARRALTRSVVAARTEVGSRHTEATVVPGERAAAVSLPGRRPTILVSSGLQASLTPEQLEAVVEHERGHLRHKHHRMVQLAHLQYSALPLLPCARALDRSVRMLVELAADDYATRRCGRATTVSALRAMGAVTGDDAFELRARRLEAAR